MSAWIAFGGVLIFLLYFIIRNIQDSGVLNDNRKLDEYPLVTIIVPTLNEEKNIERCLRSLLNLDYPKKEIFVVDGGSTDKTVEIVQSLGVEVIDAGPKPKDWVGKSWACHLGSKYAKGKYILFTDADTVHSPDSLRKMVEKAESNAISLLTLLPYQIAKRWYEYLTGYYFFLSWVVRGPKKNIIDPHKVDFLGIGQYLLFNAEDYRKFGGHVPIHSEVVEDMALAKHVKNNGGRLWFEEAEGLVSCRMYPDGFSQFYQGFKKVLWNGTKMVSPKYIFIAFMWLLWGFYIPYNLVVSLLFLESQIDVILSLSAYVIYAGILYSWWHKYQDDIWWVYVFYPVFLLIIVGILAIAYISALLKKPVQWKGISYDITGKESTEDTVSEGSFGEVLPSNELVDNAISVSKSPEVVMAAQSSNNGLGDEQIISEGGDFGTGQTLMVMNTFQISQNPVNSLIAGDGFKDNRRDGGIEPSVITKSGSATDFADNKTEKGDGDLKFKPRRIVALDFLRGISILLMAGFHSMERAVREGFWDDYLKTAPIWHYILLGPLLIFMAWRSFFILISASAYSYTFELKLRKGFSHKKLVKDYILKGSFIFLLGFIFNIFFYPDAAIGTFLVTGRWDPSRFLYRTKISDALQMIGLGMIIVSLIHSRLLRDEGWKKRKRNITVYLALSIIVIILTPILNTLLERFTGITREEIPNLPTHNLSSFIGAVILANLVGVEEPLFPFVTTTFMGTVIGLILGQGMDKSEGPSRKGLKQITIFGASVVAFGLAYWALIDGFAPLSPYIIAPLWFIIFNSGMQILTVSLALRIFDFEPNEKVRYRRIRHSRPVRRAGLLSLSVFMYQFIDIIPRIFLTLITPYDFFHLHTVNSIFVALLLFLVVVLYWMSFLRLWERVGYGASMERLVGLIFSSKKSRTHTDDPLNMEKTLYAPEIPAVK